MAANLLDGKIASEALLSEVKSQVSSLSSVVSLAIVHAGEDAASQIYMKKKVQACENAGVRCEVVSLPANTAEAEAIRAVQDLNTRADISGIIVQLPLPRQLDEFKLQSLILPCKDADGFGVENLDRLFAGKPKITPATPEGIMRLLSHYKIPIAGKHAVVVGRSNIVGKPLAQLLLAEDATVTIAHSKTKNLASITKQADLLFVAAGKPKLITAKMVKKGAVVVDVGMNRAGGKGDGAAPSGDSGGRLVGDVDFAGVSKIASWITPVPGGVGPMTVAALLANTIACHKLQRQ